MKALNLPILEQVIHVPRDRVESAREELESIGTQLRDCERFQRAVIDGCLMALYLWPHTPLHGSNRHPWHADWHGLRQGRT